MTATGHAVIGAVIAAKIGNPYLAIPLALLSHIAADAFPHWDPATNAKKKTRERLITEAAFDVAFGFVLAAVILGVFFPHTNPLYAFVMIIAAQGLDWITAPYYFLRIKKPPFIWCYKFQKFIENRMDKPWGIINQIAILILLMVLAKLF